MESIRESRQFGRRQSSSIVISANGRVREYRVGKATAITIACAFVMLMSGYLAATAYLVFRDDVLTASLANQVRMKHEYEDRIAALRAKVDRITSRQLLDQQAVEAKVAALMRQQEMLSGRSGEIEDLFERADRKGIEAPVIPVPQPNPERADAPLPARDTDSFQTGSIDIGGIQLAGTTDFMNLGEANKARNGVELALNEAPLSGQEPLTGLAAIDSVAGESGLFAAVSDQIRSIEDAQIARLSMLQQRANSRATRLAGIFAKLGVPAPEPASQAMGGPFMPASLTDFEELTESLSSTLQAIDHLEAGIRKLPVAAPIPGAEVTSSFGKRVDPFFRKTAFHAGIDFRAPTGKPVEAAGAGRVVKAGRSGGYGLMVEIDHGNGITTRYAHLSKILVNKGAQVEAGKRIGLVGSTGRSTGPHLHYEIRRSNKPANPAHFLEAGRRAGISS